MSALVERLIASRDAIKMLGLDHYDAVREAREVMADAANALAEREVRIKQLEGWWYAVPEEQRFGIMSDSAWERHKAAGPK